MPAFAIGTRHQAVLTTTIAAFVLVLFGVANRAAAAGLIPSAGEIVRQGTLLDGPCSGYEYPQVRFEDYTRDWGPEKDGTSFTATNVYTEFFELDSQGQYRVVDVHASLSWYAYPKPHCAHYQADAKPGTVFADDRGIWLMRVHRVQVHKIFDSVTGWVSSAGDRKDVTTDIRFDVVGPNTCGNSAWIGVGPTDPACLRQKQKKAAADMAKWEQLELQVEQPDYQSMCGLGNLHGSIGYNSGQAGACIGYLLSIKSEKGDMQANQRLANDPPNPDYTTLTVARPAARPELSKLPAAWTAYRAVLIDFDLITAYLWRWLPPSSAPTAPMPRQPRTPRPTNGRSVRTRRRMTPCTMR